MIKAETREYIHSVINASPEGVSLSQLHSKVHRKLTRLQLRTMLDGLYMRSQVSKERIEKFNRRETHYYPFSGKPPVKKKRKGKTERDSPMLSMKDFMPGQKYAPYIDF